MSNSTNLPISDPKSGPGSQNQSKETSMASPKLPSNLEQQLQSILGTVFTSPLFSELSTTSSNNTSTRQLSHLDSFLASHSDTPPHPQAKISRAAPLVFPATEENIQSLTHHTLSVEATHYRVSAGVWPSSGFPRQATNIITSHQTCLKLYQHMHPTLVSDKDVSAVFQYRDETKIYNPPNNSTASVLYKLFRNSAPVSITLSSYGTGSSCSLPIFQRFQHNANIHSPSTLIQAMHMPARALNDSIELFVIRGLPDPLHIQQHAFYCISKHVQTRFQQAHPDSSDQLIFIIEDFYPLTSSNIFETIVRVLHPPVPSSSDISRASLLEGLLETPTPAQFHFP